MLSDLWLRVRVRHYEPSRCVAGLLGLVAVVLQHLLGELLRRLGDCHDCLLCGLMASSAAAFVALGQTHCLSEARLLWEQLGG